MTNQPKALGSKDDFRQILEDLKTRLEADAKHLADEGSTDPLAVRIHLADGSELEPLAVNGINAKLVDLVVRDRVGNAGSDALPSVRRLRIRHDTITRITDPDFIAIAPGSAFDYAREAMSSETGVAGDLLDMAAATAVSKLYAPYMGEAAFKEAIDASRRQIIDGLPRAVPAPPSS